jgi:hypothetical protein
LNVICFRVDVPVLPAHRTGAAPSISIRLVAKSVDLGEARQPGKVETRGSPPAEFFQRRLL